MLLQQPLHPSITRSIHPPLRRSNGEGGISSERGGGRLDRWFGQDATHPSSTLYPAGDPSHAMPGQTSGPNPLTDWEGHTTNKDTDNYNNNFFSAGLRIRGRDRCGDTAGGHTHVQPEDFVINCLSSGWDFSRAGRNGELGACVSASGVRLVGDVIAAMVSSPHHPNQAVTNRAGLGWGGWLAGLTDLSEEEGGSKSAVLGLGWAAMRPHAGRTGRRVIGWV